jgi:hypothetical protein
MKRKCSIFASTIAIFWIIWFVSSQTSYEYQFGYLTSSATYIYEKSSTVYPKIDIGK